MLAQQPLILALALAAAFSVPDSDSLALEESMTLPFAKALIPPKKPFIEVLSTQGIYISKANVLALADTQCLHTETPQVQSCFGNRWPTQVRLLPHGHLKIGLHSLGLSRLEYIHHLSFFTEPLFPGQDALPELNPVARAIVTKILQGIEEQSDIIEKARQRSLMLSHLSNNKNHHKSHHTMFAIFKEPLGEGGAAEATEENAEKDNIEKDSESIQWWGFAQRPAPDTNDSDVARVRFDNNILLKPDTRYCFTPGAEIKVDRQTALDEGSGSGDNGSSGKSNDSDNDSDEEDTDVEFTGTTQDPFPVAREIREYCMGLEQRKIKQEPLSDSEIATKPEVDNKYSSLGQVSEIFFGLKIEMDFTHQLPADPPPPTTRKKSTHSNNKSRSNKSYSCKVCGRAFTQSSHLKAHLRIHSGEKPYPCKVCGKKFAQSGHLTKHLRIHSGEKPFSCKVCGRAFTQSSQLKTHQRTHSGEKPFSCQVCGKTFARDSTLKAHLSLHNGKRPYPCHECGKAFTQNSHLKTHLRIHSGEKPYLCQECGKRFVQGGHLKRHQLKHRTRGEPSTTKP